ncbi:MAG: hypothetical protein ACOVLH_17340 [Roseateles sp.]
MNRFPAPNLFPALLLLLATAAPAAPPLPTSELAAHIDAVTKGMAEAQARSLGKSAAFCAGQQLPPGRQLESSLKAYVAAFAAGSQAAMSEIAQRDKDFVRSTPPMSAKDLEGADQSAQLLLKRVQSAPAQECAGLSGYLEAGTAEKVKDFTLQSYQEFKAKRAEYCARQPKPKNCP